MYPGTSVHGDHSEVPKGRKGCTRRLVRNQLASISPQYPVCRSQRLSSIFLNTLDLMDMPLDLAHISVACSALAPVENESKEKRQRRKQKKKRRAKKGPNLGKEERKNKSQVYSFAIQPQPNRRNLTNPMYYIPVAQHKS